MSTFGSGSCSEAIKEAKKLLWLWEQNKLHPARVPYSCESTFVSRSSFCVRGASERLASWVGTNFNFSRYLGYTYISFECNRNVCMCSQLHKPLCAQILNYSQRNFLFDFEYLRYWKKISTYFLKLIPNHPAWRKVKMQPWEVMGEKLVFIRSRDQCSAKRKRRFHLPVRWGIGLGYDLR